MLVVAIITTRYVHDSTHHGSNPSAHILSDKMGGYCKDCKGEKLPTLSSR
jgi:hypothetical protein